VVVDLMLTLTRKAGQRVLIGAIEVEVVETRRDSIVLRVHGVEDEATVQLVDTPAPPSTRSRPAPRRRRAVSAPWLGEPVIVEKRRTLRRS
jgi:hypothetical protein